MKPTGPTPQGQRFRFDAPLRLVCLACGRAVLGPIVAPFDVIENGECDICASPGQVVQAHVFRNYEHVFSRR